MDRQDFILLGVFLVLMAFISFDYGLGVSYLEPQVESSFGEDYTAVHTASDGFEALVVAESRNSFSAEDLERRGSCDGYVEMPNSLFQRTSSEGGTFRTEAFSGLALYRFSDSVAEKVAEFNKSYSSGIADTAYEGDKIYLGVNKLSADCDFSERKAVSVLSEEGGLEESFYLQNQSGKMKSLEISQEGNIYVLTSNSVGKYSENGERVWITSFEELHRDFKAKNFDLTSGGIFVGFEDTNGQHRLKVSEIGLGGDKIWTFDKDLPGVKDRLQSLKVTEDGNIVLLASVINSDTMDMPDLVLQKTEPRSGEKIWSRQIDSKEPSSERKGKIHLGEEIKVYSKMEEYSFERYSYGFTTTSEIKTGLTTFSTDGKLQNNFKTKEQATGISQIFRINDKAFIAKNSKITELNPVEKPLTPEIKLDLPRWIPYLTPKPGRFQEEK